MTDHITPADDARRKLDTMIRAGRENLSSFPIADFPRTEEQAREDVQAGIEAADLTFRKDAADVLLAKLYERTEIGMIPAKGTFTGNDFFDEVTYTDIMEEAADSSGLEQ